MTLKFFLVTCGLFCSGISLASEFDACISKTNAAFDKKVEVVKFVLSKDMQICFKYPEGIKYEVCSQDAYKKYRESIADLKMKLENSYKECEKLH